MKYCNILGYLEPNFIFYAKHQIKNEFINILLRRKTRITKAKIS